MTVIVIRLNVHGIEDRMSYRPVCTNVRTPWTLRQLHSSIYGQKRRFMYTNFGERERKIKKIGRQKEKETLKEREKGKRT